MSVNCIVMKEREVAFVVVQVCGSRRKYFGLFIREQPRDLESETTVELAQPSTRPGYPASATTIYGAVELKLALV